jgi:hypothetical protein
MNYKITNPLETVTFVEGYNQYGPNSLSHHEVFIGDDGERYIPKPGQAQVWIRLDGVKKEWHDPIKFLQQAQRHTGIPTSEQQLTEAQKPTSQIQRMPPAKVLTPNTPDWRL